MLTSLELLDLSDTLVSDEGAAHLCRCRRMSWLALCNTDCGDKTAASLACMVSNNKTYWCNCTCTEGGEGEGGGGGGGGEGCAQQQQMGWCHSSRMVTGGWT